MSQGKISLIAYAGEIIPSHDSSVLNSASEGECKALEILKNGRVISVLFDHLDHVSGEKCLLFTIHLYKVYYP